MDYGEEIQVAATAVWDIRIGDHRHVSIVDASVDMVKDTAAALSAAYPDKDVWVAVGLGIRYWFRAGVETDIASDIDVKTRCPFRSSQYRQCWECGSTFPVEAWVDVKKDGTKSII